MNREIKFRGKNYENKWKYGDLVQEKWKQGKAIMIKKETTAWSVLEDTVGQYTGLHDKIGKVIYEHNGFSIDVTNMNKNYGRVSFVDNFIEVIGNIYENPELLGGMNGI